MGKESSSQQDAVGEQVRQTETTVAEQCILFICHKILYNLQTRYLQWIYGLYILVRACLLLFVSIS